MTLDEFCLALSKSLKLCAEAPVTLHGAAIRPLWLTGILSATRQSTDRPKHRTHWDPGEDTRPSPGKPRAQASREHRDPGSLGSKLPVWGFLEQRGPRVLGTLGRARRLSRWRPWQERRSFPLQR